MNSKAWEETIDLVLTLLPDDGAHAIHRERLMALRGVVSILAKFLDPCLRGK